VRRLGTRHHRTCRQIGDYEPAARGAAHRERPVEGEPSNPVGEGERDLRRRLGASPPPLYLGVDGDLARPQRREERKLALGRLRSIVSGGRRAGARLCWVSASALYRSTETGERQAEGESEEWDHRGAAGDYPRLMARDSWQCNGEANPITLG